MRKQMTYAEKHVQIKKEAKITTILFLFLFLWWTVTGWGLSDVKIYFYYLPLWFWLSVFGTYIIGCVGCIWLVKKVFIDFDLGEEEDDRIESVIKVEEGGAKS